MIQIRRYASTDAAAVSEIIRTTMRTSNAADYPADRLQPLIDYFSPEKVDQINEGRVCLVAAEARELIATAALEGNELVTFFVLPERQGKGVGSALLRALEGIARADGLGELRVDASVTGAAFYERHGYARTGAVLAGTAGPQISMEKRIE